MLISSIAEAKDDIFEAIKAMLALREVKIAILEVLHELYGVVGRFALAVGGHDEHDGAVFGNGIEVFEFVLFGIAY